MRDKEAWSLQWLAPALAVVALAAGTWSSFFKEPMVQPEHAVLPGRIVPFRALDASAELSGTVEQVMATRGMKVSEGQLLAVVNGEQTSQSMQRAAAGQPRPGPHEIVSQQVRAPQSGTVLSVAARQGLAVWPGMPLVTIADLTYLRVDVPISASMAHSISAGTPVVIRLPIDVPGQIASTVSAVALRPGLRYQSYVAQITIPNPKPGAILAGARCTAEFLPDMR